MLVKQARKAEARRTARKTELRWNVLLKDLSFLATVSRAQLMVWRVLRRRRSERIARLRRIKLVPDANHEEDK